MEVGFLFVVFIHVAGLLAVFFGISFQIASSTAVAFDSFLGLTSLFVAAVRTLVEDRHLVKR